MCNSKSLISNGQHPIIVHIMVTSNTSVCIQRLGFKLGSLWMIKHPLLKHQFITVTDCPLKYLAIILKAWFSNSSYRIVARTFTEKLLSGESHRAVAFHDDVIKWKHFPRYWPFVQGSHRSPVNSPQKDQWRGALMFSLICAWTNSWANNGDAGDLRRHRAHYDVIVLWKVNTGEGNGLVPSGNRPLPEPMLNQIYVAIWRHWDTISLKPWLLLTPFRPHVSAFASLWVYDRYYPEE